MRISIINVTKNFGSAVALRDIALQIEAEHLCVLLRPSGCGKITFRSVIADLYERETGELLFGQRSSRSVPPHRRNTSMVFQNYALWPHMTVAENVSYG